MKKSTDNTNNPEWLDALCNDVNHYDAVPPISEWEHIAASLDAKLAADTATVVMLRRRRSLWIGGISAVAAVLLLGFILFIPLDDGVPSSPITLGTEHVVVNQVVPTTSSDQTVLTNRLDKVEVVVNEVSSNKMVPSAVHQNQLVAVHDNQLVAVHDNQLAAVHVVTPSKHISSESVETQKSDIITPENKDEATRLSDAQNKQREDLEQLKMENERLERQNEELIRTFAHTKKSSISIGLMADAGLVNQSMVTGSTNQNVYLSVSDVNYESSTTDARGIKLYSSNDLAFIAKPSYSYNHKHPLSIGLSFAKYYTSRLALVTGLNYTKLSADVTDEVDNRTFQQTIHYLSIPIAIQWTLIQQQHYNYNVYMSVGTAIGRNVSAHIDDQSVSVHGIQVSLNTSLGAQYFLLPHWSIFSEVGYAKFYDDDKRIETYRDTHSTDFTFSFGCRWHL